MPFSLAKRSWQSRSNLSSRRPRSARLTLERLEDRVVLAPAGFTPAQISQAYGFNQIEFNFGHDLTPADGTGQTIAIVDAYDDPNLIGDVNTFDEAYGLTYSNAPTLYQQYGASSSFLTKVNEYGYAGPLPETDPTINGVGNSNIPRPTPRSSASVGACSR
jgi:hypothetical protein